MQYVPWLLDCEEQIMGGGLQPPARDLHWHQWSQLPPPLIAFTLALECGNQKSFCSWGVLAAL
jgi:hypothetical protein